MKIEMGYFCFTFIAAAVVTEKPWVIVDGDRSAMRKFSFVYLRFFVHILKFA